MRAKQDTTIGKQNEAKERQKKTNKNPHIITILELCSA